jgi:hypothetical protein
MEEGKQMGLANWMEFLQLVDEQLADETPTQDDNIQ